MSNNSNNSKNYKDIIVRIGTLSINISQNDENLILDIDPQTKKIQQKKTLSKGKRKASETINQTSKVQKVNHGDVKTQTTHRITFDKPVTYPNLEIPSFGEQILNPDGQITSPEFASFLREHASRSNSSDTVNAVNAVNPTNSLTDEQSQEV